MRGHNHGALVVVVVVLLGGLCPCGAASTATKTTTTTTVSHQRQPQCVLRMAPYNFEAVRQDELRQQELAIKLNERKRRLEEDQRRKQEAEQRKQRLRDEQNKRQQQKEQANQRRQHEQQQQHPGKATTTDCPYKILGVPMDASRAEIKKAFRTLSLQYHPDKNTDQAATDKFTQLVNAYEILGDEDRRAMYDNDTFGAYQSRPHNFHSKANFYEGTALITPLNQTEFDRLVLCKGPFLENEECAPWMVNYYAPWCVHCKNMIPDWKRTAFTMDGTETPLGFVRFGSVNCELNKKLCVQQGARSFPGIFLYARDAMGQGHREKFPSTKPRSVESLVEHAEKGVRLAHEATLQAVDGFKMETNVTNMDSKGLWLVMFENSLHPPNPQADSLKAHLRRMSANIRGLASFGVLDCGKEPKVCEQQYIGKQYPVLKLYPYQGAKGTGETLVKPGEDPLAALPIAEKVIRMCIANIEAENGLMHTMHEEFEEPPPPPPPQYEYPKPEQTAHRVLPAGVRATTAQGRTIGSG